MCLILLFIASVQIIVESLPVSSSGHLLLLQQLYGLPPLTATVEYLLHGPTVVMLAFYFRQQWIPIVMHMRRYQNVIKHLFMFGFCAELTTVVLYFFMKQYVQSYVPLWFGFLITASALFLTRHKSLSVQVYEPLTFYKMIVIAAVQGIAALPGLSRLGLTYSVGLWLGLTPRKSFLTSCMLQWPLILAGFLYGLYDIYVHPQLPMIGEGIVCVNNLFMWVTIIIATICAYFVLRLVQNSLYRGTIWRLGYYMLIPAFLACCF